MAIISLDELEKKATTPSNGVVSIDDLERRVLESKPKPMFSTKEEADKGQALAQKELRKAQAEASPLAVISKGLDLASLPAMNASTFGIPDMISKATTGKSIIPSDAQNRTLSEIAGFSGAGGLIKGIGERVIPKVAGEGVRRVIARSAVEGGAGGALFPADSAEDRVKNAVVGAGTGTVIGAGTKIPQAISKIRDYPANKVNAIRDSFWKKTAPTEWKAYGDAIENLPNQGGGAVDGAQFLQNVEKNFVDRGLMAPDGKMLRPLSSADSKMLKAYESVYRKWSSSKDGKIDIKDIVDEYKNIKGNFSKKGTITSRENTQAANEFFNSASDQIDNQAFNAAKARYRSFKQDQQLIDESVGLYDPPMKTAKGERWLTQGDIGDTAQGRRTAKMITARTGQELRGAKLLSKRKYINPLNLIPKSK